MTNKFVIGMDRIHFAIRLSTFAMIFLVAPAALAQAPYPSQQIKIICPFPAGGGTDLTVTPTTPSLRDTPPRAGGELRAPGQPAYSSRP